MRAKFSLFVVTAALCLGADAPLPVRGIHISAPKPDEMPACLRFIREGMPKEGANLLVLEFNYRYQYTKRLGP